ncbi:MAG: TIGR01777 family oxidoreductase [Bdellovibrionales bacterium]|nr:TIGR01777 family oxidoreductase [Bdellovibrionales bacterium]
MKNPNERILISGATGLVGRALCELLFKEGKKLVVLGRDKESVFRKKFSIPCEYYRWRSPADSKPPKEAFDVNAVIHLAGEPLAKKRWNDDLKKSFYASRVNSTKNLVAMMKESGCAAEVFLSASAIGIYEESGEKNIHEDFPKGKGFLSALCRDWEFESKHSPCRSIQLRFGIILDDQQGALREMIPVFKIGLGGVLGDGHQWMSWIHRQDVVEIIYFLLKHKDFSGPVNVVAPNPVTNEEFTKKLASALKVKAFLSVPKIVLKIAKGEMAEVILQSQKVSSSKIINLGYSFKYKNLEYALEDLLAEN